MKTLISTILTIALLTMPSITLNQVYAKESPVMENSAVQMKVNVNKATIEQLSALKGIGVKRAEAIIEYRTTYGEFKSVEDLLNVKGIGEKFILNNKVYLEI